MGDFCEFLISPKKLTALAPRGYNHLIKRQRRGFFRWQTKLESDTSAASAAPSSSLREARSRAASNAAGSRWAKSKETANAEPTRTTLPMRNVRDDGSLHQARTGRHSLLRSRDAGAAAAKAPVFRLARAISANAPANPDQRGRLYQAVRASSRPPHQLRKPLPPRTVGFRRALLPPAPAPHRTKPFSLHFGLVLTYRASCSPNSKPFTLSGCARSESDAL